MGIWPGGGSGEGWHSHNIRGHGLGGLARAGFLLWLVSVAGIDSWWVWPGGVWGQVLPYMAWGLTALCSQWAWLCDLQQVYFLIRSMGGVWGLGLAVNGGLPYSATELGSPKFRGWVLWR